MSPFIMHRSFAIFTCCVGDISRMYQLMLQSKEVKSWNRHGTVGYGRNAPLLECWGWSPLWL